MFKIVVYYMVVSLFLGTGVFCYLALKYTKLYQKVVRKRSRKETAIKGDIITILIISIAVTLFWLPLLAWYAFNKAKSKLKKS